MNGPPTKILISLAIAVVAYIIWFIGNRHGWRGQQRPFPLMRRELTFWDFVIAITLVSAVVAAGWFWPR